MAVQSKIFSVNKTLKVKGQILHLATPKVMGIVNITPDSFYSGSRFTDISGILKKVESMIEEGADLIDVGGYSSRPGALDITQEEELDRVIPAVTAIRTNFPNAIISIDTFRSRVALEAIREGADMVNDISGGDLDPHMIRTVADLKVPYIAMHMRGTPQTMNQLTQYENVTKEVIDYFQRKLLALRKAGITDVIVDPGFGFAKTVAQNFELLRSLELFQILERPLLVGLSRKSMIWRTLNLTPELALNGTTALNAIALMKGATLLRVHDVREAREVIQLVSHLQGDR